MTEFLFTAAGCDDAPILLLAHGAGAPMDSAFLGAAARLLAETGVSVARFEFQYMAARRAKAGRRPPPKVDALADEYRTAVSDLKRQHAGTRLFIGGKSMGGRVASMVADDLFEQGRISGCVCLGYPFHPAKQPTKLRTAHLTMLTCPTLMVQGERDPLGNRADVTALTLSSALQFSWIADGDHDFRPRVSSGKTQAANLQDAADSVARFVLGPASTRTPK